MGAVQAIQDASQSGYDSDSISGGLSTNAASAIVGIDGAGALFDVCSVSIPQDSVTYGSDQLEIVSVENGVTAETFISYTVQSSPGDYTMSQTFSSNEDRIGYGSFSWLDAPVTTGTADNAILFGIAI
ncbi:hypothetical protein THIOSC15_2010003 [uncultured Thiomicrorhabdus sp.]